MSHGQFTPQFDIVGPVTVSKNSAYYGGNGSSRDDADLHFVDMMKEACQLMDSKLNFADYDSNGDKYVDLVYFIYAGYSESIGAIHPTVSGLSLVRKASVLLMAYR